MNNTFDEILTQFARRDTAGYIVWGQKLKAAHNEEVSNLHKEVVASNESNDSLSKQLRECVGAMCRFCRESKPQETCINGCIYLNMAKSALAKASGEEAK